MLNKPLLKLIVTLIGTDLVLAIQNVLYEARDGRLCEIGSFGLEFDHVIAEVDVSHSGALICLQAEELHDTGVVIVADINVDEEDLP